MLTKFELNRPKITQLGIIAMLLFVCTAFVYLNPSRSLTTLLIGLVPAAVALWFGLTYPQLGTVAIIVATLAVPFEIGTGTESSINAGMLLLIAQLGLWVFHALFVDHAFKLMNERVVWAALALIGAAIFGFLAGQVQWFSISGAGIAPQIGGLLMFVLSAAALIMVGHQLSARHLQWMVMLFLILGAVFMLARIVPSVGRVVLPRFPSGATGSMFWVWLGGLSFAQALFNHRLSIMARLLCGLLVGMMLYVALLTEARSWSSGWLPLVATLGSILLFYIARLRPRLLLLLLPLMLAGFIMVVANAVQTVDSVTNFSDESYSLLTRLDAYEIVLELAHRSPLFGLGPANYYWYTPLIPIRGWYVQFNSHSQIIDLVAQVGYIGLAVYVWVLLEVGLLAWRLLPRVRAGFPTAYLLATLGGVVGTVIASALGDWVIPFVYNIGLTGFRASILAWLFMGGVLVFVREEVVSG